jgi:glycosyltransferase involved in cell wall biosynthesis
MKAVAHRLVKQPAYRRVVRHADRVILNVPETQEIVRPWLGSEEQEELRRKAVQLRLGFDPAVFFFDPGERSAWRSEHGISSDELVLVTCTRATPSKRLEDVIDAVSRLRGHGHALRYALSGLLDDSYAQTLRAHAARQPEPDAFLLLPLLDHDGMRVLFSGCDLGFWPQAAITIQQAMGTGLPVVLRDRPTVSHLLKPGVNGWYGRSDESTEQLVAPALSALGDRSGGDTERSATAALNREYLSYDGIAVEMLSGL